MKRKWVDDVPGAGSIDLQVLCLTGEEFRLNVHHDTLGREVYRMVSEQLPPKRGAKFSLYHLESKLVLTATLQEQGLASAATLSCTRVPTNVYDAWCYVEGEQNVNADEIALEGVTKLDCAPPGEYLRHLPQTLESLAFGDRFNHSLEGVPFPSGLQSLTFGDRFNHSLA